VEVLIEDAGSGVRLLTLNRPESYNALTGPMASLLLRSLLDADADPAVRAVVITGAGKGFCAGADLPWLSEVVASGDPLQLLTSEPTDTLLELGVPVIAAVNGAVAGVGFAQMLMCDVRFCAEGARISTSFARRGLVAEHGTSWLLPHVVGLANALDLLMTGRTIDAQEALRIGLVQRVLPLPQLLPAALAYARELATLCSPRSVATIRRQVYGDLERTRAEALQASVELMLDSMTWPDVVEGVASHLQKRPPDFAPYERRSSS
jgi:enoyl-CoA hydratase/carnithine racemase